MLLHISRSEALTPDIRLLRLQAPDGATLPNFEPGAHVELGVPVGGATAWRKYSLVSDGEDGSHYEIAVKRNAHGRGGSAALHDVLAVGDALEVSAPANEFGIADEAQHHVLVAGGIGITPMRGIAARLKRSGASYELHYAAANAEAMAFRDEVAREHGERARLYFTRDDAPRRMDVAALLAPQVSEACSHVYVCGPARLIDHVRLAAEARGVARRRVHFESFGPAWSPTDGPVRMRLAESAIELQVEPGTTLLDAMEGAGAWIPSDCRRGECGACIASYTGGRPVHRDNCLTEAQRTHSFCPCVSWAASDEVLVVQA